MPVGDWPVSTSSGQKKRPQHGGELRPSFQRMPRRYASGRLNQIYPGGNCSSDWLFWHAPCKGITTGGLSVRIQHSATKHRFKLGGAVCVSGPFWFCECPISACTGGGPVSTFKASYENLFSLFQKDGHGEKHRTAEPYSSAGHQVPPFWLLIRRYNCAPLILLIICPLTKD
jgi:hypothetical protein